MPMTQATPSHDLVTLRQAAVILCVHYNTVLLWARKGVFGAVVRVGPSKSLRLYRAAVMAERRESSAS